ncbi:hypothetical protein FZEAL_4584 [Fusarium zealandicum]|uniref:Methyltransferase n=1 Tax=Fusarium zealandicum TaxID=1053134 RepID=A0A8H4ULX4_9HYPO|nr:hypothetical protein FZEAL_4584 [Fusarium zealandicum]
MAEQARQSSGERPGVSATAQEDPRENRLEADDNSRESDSTFEGGYLTSLKSSIYSYRYEPNDDEEQNRMDLVHHVYSLMLGGKLHRAPIGEHTQRVLDLGTGTGIWAIDFAEVPANCVFEVDDFEDQWLYKKPFDYIHARELEGCIANEERFFQQAFENIASGGFIELQAMRGCFMSDDGTSETATNAQRWAEGLLDSSAKFGKPIDCVHLWKDKLSQAGFVDIQQEVRKVSILELFVEEVVTNHTIKIPIGQWPKDPVLKEVGKYQEMQSLQAIDSYTPRLFDKILGWPMDEIQVLMAQAKKELRDPAIHLYLPVYFIWGKKP